MSVGLGVGARGTKGFVVTFWLSALGVRCVRRHRTGPEWSGWSGGGEGPDSVEGAAELVGPRPVGGKPEGGGAGLVDEDSGERDEPVADGARGPDWAVETDDPCPSGEVVCEDRACELGPMPFS